MTRIYFFGTVLLFLLAKLMMASGKDTENTITPGTIAAYKLQNAIGCSLDDYSSYATTAEVSIPVLQGWGDHRMQVSTHNDSAYIYFNQGINMFYGFHFIEARASFKKAQVFDSALAMSYLGEVLTYSPNINNPAYKLRSYTESVLQKAKHFSTGASAIESALIEAQLVRYSTDTNLGSEKINQLYADAMQQVNNRFDKDADVAAIYADAIMQLHPWDLYDNVGNPKPWTASIENVLTSLISKFPDHPGLLHYYIHCVEASNTAYRGLAAARKLPKLTPGLSHMLHMSSHIYVRTGFYNDGVAANANARAAYDNYRQIFPDVQKYHSLYFTHNLNMEFANALALPQYSNAMKVAYLKRASVATKILNGTADASADEQYGYSFPMLAWIRYGKWDSLLNDKPVPGNVVYASLLQHFGRGVALARKNKIAEAEKELAAMSGKFDAPVLQEHSKFSNAPATGLSIARLLLKGVISEQLGDLATAIKNFQAATVTEDAMVYNEPQDWLLSARHYLGACLLKAKRYTQAKEVFLEDLRLNPSNAWSLTGLIKAWSQLKEKNTSKAQQELNTALQGADIQVTASVF